MRVQPAFGGNGDKSPDVSNPKPVNLEFGLRLDLGPTKAPQCGLCILVSG